MCSWLFLNVASVPYLTEVASARRCSKLPLYPTEPISSSGSKIYFELVRMDLCFTKNKLNFCISWMVEPLFFQWAWIYCHRWAHFCMGSAQWRSVYSAYCIWTFTLELSYCLVCSQMPTLAQNGHLIKKSIYISVLVLCWGAHTAWHCVILCYLIFWQNGITSHT